MIDFLSVLDRVFTLVGARESVNHAKDLLNKLCDDHNTSSGVETVSCILVPPPGVMGYASYIEIMVPGSKVGLVIGKGGETIKTLQEKTGAKMVIIQDGPNQEVVSLCANRNQMKKFRFIETINVFLRLGKTIENIWRSTEDRAR